MGGNGRASATPKRGSRKAGSSASNSLPKMPSLPGLSKLAESPSAPSSPSKLKASAAAASPAKRRFRQSKSSDDPSTVNGTEESDMSDNDIEQSIMSVASTSNGYAARARSKSVASRSSMAASSKQRGTSAQEAQNICVCVRVRPPAPGSPEDIDPIWDLDTSTGRVGLTDFHPVMEKRKGTASTEDAYSYRFDSILQSPEVTEKLYSERIGSVVEAAMEGFNATVFSYGQTGSGKTHTMMGNDDEPGIIPQAVQDIFKYIQDDPAREFLLRISYLEIYNETLKDLLVKPPTGAAGNNGKNKELTLREEKGRIVVQGLTEEIVKDPRGVVACLLRGEENRSVAGTDWNARSSRSHCVFSMIIESRPKAALPSSESTELPYASSSATLSAQATGPPKGEVRVSQLNLIDLAGSERATSQEQRRKEGAFINKSLLSLGTVMQKLADPKTSGGHIPFRDSKLTRLLQTSLSGNARVAVICTISPEAQHGEESLSTLKFASRAMKIVTKAERGVVVDGATGLMIAKYEAQVQDLERRLLEAEAAQREANGRLGTPRPDLQADRADAEEERQKRLEAEAASEERRLMIIKMEQDIALLQSQIITSQTPASGPAATEGEDDEAGNESRYGNIGYGDGPARPAGPRGKRRISELAFGIGTPMSKLRGHTGSIRSFSSALETVKSPSLASLARAGGGDDERVAELEKEVEMLRAALASSGSEKRDQADLQQRVDDLECRLQESESRLGRAREERDEAIRGEGDKAGQIMRLQQELEQLQSKQSEASFTAHEAASGLQAEVEELRERLSAREVRVSDLEEKLAGANAAHASEVYILTSQLAAVQKKADGEAEASMKGLRELKEQLKEADEAFEKLEKSQGQAAGSARKQLQAAERRAEEAERQAKELQTRLEAQEASSKAALARAAETSEGRLQALQRQQGDKLSSLREQHGAELSELLAASEARTIESAAEQRRLSSQVSVLTRDLEVSRATVASQQGAIADLTAEVEKKQATRAAIAAAHAPPDFSSLHARIAAVSGKSRSALGSSLSSSTSSRRSGEEDQVETLKTALSTAKAECSHAKDTVRDQEGRIQRMQGELAAKDKEIESVKSDVKKFRADIDKMDGLFRNFRDTLCSACAANMPLGGSSAVPAVADRAPPPRSPFGALSGYGSQQALPKPSHSKSASLNYGSYLKTSSRPGTPTKSDSKHGYTGLHGTPEPLPIPSDWSGQRKDVRRASLARELDGLAAARRTVTSKTALLSPTREEKRTLPTYASEYGGPGSPSRRSAKSSAESQLWSR